MTSRTEIALRRLAVQQQREQRWLDNCYPTRRVDRGFQRIGVTMAEMTEAMRRLQPVLAAFWPIWRKIAWHRLREMEDNNG